MYSIRYKSHHDASRQLKQLYTLPVSKEAYIADILEKPLAGKRVIYLHVPFCNKICSFCPFHRFDEMRRREYHHYLIDHMQRLSNFPYMQQPFQAVNFGGGTPTCLLPEQMEQILKALKTYFPIAQDAEISVESSATELTDEMLDVLRQGGVNRLSIGVQSFQDGRRKMLGRRGSGEFAAERVAAAIRVGITNTSIDLLYNLPGQSEEELYKDLQVIRRLNVAGISFYSLMLHENTPLYKKLGEQERQSMADVQHEYALYSLILNELAKGGFQMLELTKLVRDGLDRYDYMEIRHNRGNCIAVGHGAGGNIEGYLYHNSIRNPDISNALPISSVGRVVSDDYHIMDQFIYSLQKAKADLHYYSEQLGMDLSHMLAEPLERMEKDGLLVRADGMLTMTQKGTFWGNNMIDELITFLREQPMQKTC